jgi:hypothetical protein
MSTTTVPFGAPVGPLERQRLIDAQRARGLQAAMRVSMGRRALLDRLHALPPSKSCDMAAEILEDVPEVLASLRVGVLFRSVRRMFGRTAERMCEVSGVDEKTTLAALTGRQRAALIALLRMRAWSSAGSDASIGSLGNPQNLVHR